MRFLLIGLILVGILNISHFALAEMASTSYQIKWDTVSQGGSDTSSSASYILRDTLGNSGAGESNSDNYQLTAGYRAGIFDQILMFDVFSQENSSEQEAVNLVGNTVTTNPTNFSEEDYIVLIQNLGENQISAIGKINNIGVDSFTVDSWVTDGTSPVIDGVNDYVYKLNGLSAALDGLDDSQVNTSIIGFEVTADLGSGYTVQVYADGELKDGSSTINDVADGTVTAGNEEYGGRSSDTSLPDSTFDTEDSAFSPEFQDIVDVATPQFNNRNFLTLKASIDSGTDSGTYSQNLTFIVSGNF